LSAEDLAARGPRAEGHADALRAAVAAVRAGFEDHYGAAQHAEGRDLALLDGDRRYADGLAQLAALGDLVAIAELADAISLCAQAHADGRPELAAAAWTASAAAIGWGETPELVGAKARARAGDPGAPAALLDAVRALTGDLA
jgi:hypothetical protein